MKRQDLAIFGGKKAITHPHPHWQWPPRSEAKNQAVLGYLMEEKVNERGFPAIVSEFEGRFAAYHGRKYALALNSGTSTLHAAFFAVGLGAGDEIIAPTLTFFATATPVVQLGAIPVLCDCEPDTGNICPDDIKKRITKRTKAIVITHLCGHPCEMDAITEIARARGLALIEDCSHAHGATYRGKKVGTFGDIACFSLDNRKLLASGEGGILVTDDQRLFERALMLGDFGPRLFSDLTLPETARYRDTGFGCKYRIHPLSAAIANEEMNSLEHYIRLRKEKLDYLSKGIGAMPGIAPPHTRDYVTRGAYFGYRPFYRKHELNGLGLDVFLKILNAEGMEIRQSSHPPLHRLPLFTDKWPRYRNVSLPHSEAFFNGTASLPTFTLEPFALIDGYIRAFEKVCGYFARNKAIRPEEVGCAV